MTETQLQLERLRTLQESYNDLDDKINVVLPALADKIDNIQLPEIDTSTLAKETTLQEESAEIKNKIDNSVAKQGDDPEATNTEILKEIRKIPDIKNIYSVRFEKNDDNINTYTMVLPLVAGIEGDTIIL